MSVLTVASSLHTDFSRGRSGGPIVPSLEEFSTVCCDPHSQRDEGDVIQLIFNKDITFSVSIGGDDLGRTQSSQ